MINIINQVRRNIGLLNNIQYLFHRKPRDPSVPTQAKKIQPFSIKYLHDNPGARYTAKRLGRGPGSGKGKTSGRGHKGQLAQPGGGTHVRFEGGQTPLQKRLPKYGKVRKTRPQQYLDYVNLETIDYYVKLNVLNPNQTITVKTLIDTGIVKKSRFGVKILARGADRITYPLNLEVTDASKMAISYITKQGGNVKLIHRTSLKLREHIYPEKYPLPLLDPITPFWKVKKLQRKENDRGIPIQFPKPKWLIEDMKSDNKLKKDNEKQRFIYPVPIVQNSGKIRQRKPPVYRKINYNLP